MSLTVLLVRHGKAEGKRAGQTDAARSLTPAGHEALVSAFPRSLSLLAGSGSTPELWVSPAVRARQTAEVVAQAVAGVLGLASAPVPEPHDCLLDQDLEAFLGELSERSAQGDGTVVVVGHVPFMGRASQALCGCELPFSTGAVAAIELARDASEPGRLLWFVQGPRA